MNDIKLIAGLGNVGKLYASNRHNIGFMMLDAYANHHNSKNGMIKTSRKLNVRYSLGSVILLKPPDFMNSSGEAIKEVKEKLDIDNKNILVIHDDMDFDFSVVRLKSQTKNTKHNGVKSVSNCIGNDFARCRVGVGRPLYKDQTEYDYVLSNFSLNENKQMCLLSQLVIEIVDSFVEHGVQKTMNKYNKLGVSNG